MGNKLMLFIVVAFSFALCCFSEAIKLEIKRKVEIAGKVFGEKEVSVMCYDENGVRNPARIKQFTFLIPIEQVSTDDFTLMALCVEDNLFYKNILKKDSLVTHHKVFNKASEIAIFVSSLPLLAIDFTEKKKLSDMALFLLRRVYEIVFMHLKYDVERIGILPGAPEFISKREFTSGLANADTAVELYNLLMQVMRTGMNYSVNCRQNGEDISLAIRKIVLQWGNQIHEKAKSLPKDEYGKYVTLNQQWQQRQNQVNNQMLQLLMMNLQQNMRVANGVNAAMNMRSTPTPKLKTSKGYCARHDCHYELTQGCHFCNAPKFGITNPWHLRGNWDSDIK